MLLGDDLECGSTVTDRLPDLDVGMLYHLVAYTSSGLSATAIKTIVVPSNGSAVFNFGTDYTQVARMAMNLEFGSKTKRDKTTYTVPGRVNPIVRYGKTKTTTLSVSGDRFFDATPLDPDQTGVDAFDALEEYAGSVWFRAPHRHRRYVTIDSVDDSDAAGKAVTEVSVQMTEVSQ